MITMDHHAHFTRALHCVIYVCTTRDSMERDLYTISGAMTYTLGSVAPFGLFVLTPPLVPRARASGTSLAATQKVVEFTVLTLTNYLEQILDAIFSSVGRCPPLMRMALRQLWKRVRDRWPEEKYRDVPYLAVTGFLFLRFLVPAILAPKLFSIRDEHPDQKTERTLKLLSKVLVCCIAAWLW